MASKRKPNIWDPSDLLSLNAVYVSVIASKVSKYINKSWVTELEGSTSCMGFIMGQKLCVKSTLSIWFMFSSAISAHKGAISKRVVLGASLTWQKPGVGGWKYEIMSFPFLFEVYWISSVVQRKRICEDGWNQWNVGASGELPLSCVDGVSFP